MNTNSNAKRVLCFGDSNTWGWVPSKMGAERYDLETRWTGILQTELGDDYEIIEEGLGARTTMFDDPRPELPLRNGLSSLPLVLETHLPLDLVIVMLGTTDTKEMLGKSPEDISEGMREIVRFIKNFKTVNDTDVPKVLIVVPPIVNENAEFAVSLFKGGREKGRALKELYKTVAIEEDCEFLAPTDEVVVDEVEGVHLTKLAHEKLAEMLTENIRRIL